MTTGNSETFENECLHAHNMYRAQHGCPPLQLNLQLTDAANKWAQELIKRNIMEHSTDNKYGENIYMAQGLTVTGDMPVKAWYDEVDDYNFEESKFTPNTGHFTQVIWKNTKELGVGVAHKGNVTYVVTNYLPAGNFIGRFRENVPDLVGSAAITRRNKIEDELAGTEGADSATKLRMSITKKDERFQVECLEAHNRFRALHGVQPLQLNDNLSKYANKWAQALSNLDKLKHSATKEYGENIYMSEGIKISGASPVKVWYDEIFEYNFEAAKFTAASGGFTQIVWKDTKKLGVGIARKDRVTVVVASYSPPGNVVGHFRENVPPVGGFKESGSQDAAPSSPGKKRGSLKQDEDEAAADPGKKSKSLKDKDDADAEYDEADDENDVPAKPRRQKDEAKEEKDDAPSTSSKKRDSYKGDKDDDEDAVSAKPSKRESLKDRSKKKGSSKERQGSASPSPSRKRESLKDDKDAATPESSKKNIGSKERPDSSPARSIKKKGETSKESREASPTASSRKKGQTSKESREASPTPSSRKKGQTSKESREASPTPSSKKKGQTSKESREASPTPSSKKKSQTSKESREASPTASSRRKSQTSKESREASPAGPSKKRGEISKESSEAAPAGPSKKKSETSKESREASPAGPSKKADTSKTDQKATTPAPTTKSKTSQGDSDQSRSELNKAVQANFPPPDKESQTDSKAPLKKDAPKPKPKEASKPPAKGGAKSKAKDGKKPSVSRSPSDKPTTSRKPSTSKSNTSIKKPKPRCPHRSDESGVGIVPILLATAAMISMVVFAAYLRYTH